MYQIYNMNLTDFQIMTHYYINDDDDNENWIVGVSAHVELLTTKHESLFLYLKTVVWQRNTHSMSTYKLFSEFSTIFLTTVLIIRWRLLSLLGVGSVDIQAHKLLW